MSKKDTRTNDQEMADLDAQPDPLQLHWTGVIKIVDDNVTYRLRLPKFGEFKKIKEVVFDCTTKITDAMKELGAAPSTAGADAEAVADAVSEYVSSADKLVDVTYEQNERMMRSIFNGGGTLASGKPWEGLSDTQLPDDVDEWPAWLITDRSTTQKMLNHWRTVPLGRGSS